MSLDVTIYCDHCNSSLGDFNITHNVTPMWELAGIYDLLYKSPDGIQANLFIDKFETALLKMRAWPEKFEVLNPKNGWGSYNSAMQFLNKIIDCCKTNPKAYVKFSR